MISLIIGLGNNDTQYEHTYHNVGFLMIGWLGAQTPPLTPTLKKTDGFMNESGASVKKIMREHNLAAENILIIHDDSDIEIGQYKLSFNRGAAGHKGVQNIIDQLGTQQFVRLRIGIRPKATATARRKKADEFVLKNISKTNLALLEKIFARAAKQTETILNLQQ